MAGKQDTGSEFQSMAVRGKKLDEYHRQWRSLHFFPGGGGGMNFKISDSIHP